jgi:UDPglucose 6-dehydrogenase
MRAVAPSNEHQADWLLDRLETSIGRPLAGCRVAVLGLTFKAGTDDLRESPALRLAERLVVRGAEVVAYDPVATVEGAAQLATAGVRVDSASSAEAACDRADAVIVATEWPEFRHLDWARIGHSMRGHWVADARHVVDIDAAAAAGLGVVVLGVVVHGRPVQLRASSVVG